MERLAGLSDEQTMLCVAGDFNVQIGVVEPGGEGLQSAGGKVCHHTAQTGRL